MEQEELCGLDLKFAGGKHRRVHEKRVGRRKFGALASMIQKWQAWAVALACTCPKPLCFCCFSMTVQGWVHELPVAEGLQSNHHA